METIFRALSADADMENLSLDSAYIKVHESANGGGKTADKAVGRTRDGLNTKLHAVELLEKVKIRGSNVLADRAYGSKTIRAYISE